MPAKDIRIILLVTILSAVVILAQDSENIRNFRKLLNNPSFMAAQFKCILEGKPCDRIGLRISKLMPESVRSGQCVGCTEEELQHVEEIHALIKEKYPQKYEEIKRKFNIDDQPAE